MRLNLVSKHSTLIETLDDMQSLADISGEKLCEFDTEDKLSQCDLQNTDCVSIYLRQIGKIPLLSHDEELTLFKKIRSVERTSWRYVNDEEVNKARARIMEGNLRLVAKIALKYRNLGLPFLDLIQEGNIGLMKAIDRFDPKKGYRFTTYATWWIQQNIMRALTDHSRTIRLPAHIVERINKMNRSREYLEQKKNGQPTIEEVAQEICLSVEKVIKILDLSQSLAYLDTPIGNDEEKDCFIDFISNEDSPSPEDNLISKAMREQLEEVLNTLLPREAEILKLRFGLNDGITHTLEQLGKIFGITRERVRQIEKKAIMKLKHPKRSSKLREFIE